MKKTKEKGITLMALVITIVLLLILASVGINSGRDTIESSKFSKFQVELKVMQNKVNDLNENNDNNVGNNLNVEQNNILDIEEIGNIIYKDKTQEQKNEIKNGFKYCSKDYINETLELKEITQDFLINIDKRIVVSCEGFKYKDITYYMSEQMGELGLYNVEYNNKNISEGNFQVNATKDGDKWKINISDIEYSGYNNKWQVKYKLEEDNYWQTSENLTFYVKEEGVYIVNVIHDDEINLGNKTVIAKQTVNEVQNQILSTVKNTKLIDEFENKLVLPAGFKITEDATNVTQGIVIEDEEGNQFVWIPVGTININAEKTNPKTIELDRYTFESDGTPTGQGENVIYDYYSETSGNSVAKSIDNFKTSVEKNGGYYIGRYEAGKENNKVVSKNGTTLCNEITREVAKEKSQGMYDSTKFTSDLINSYAWDTAIVFEQTFDDRTDKTTPYSMQTTLNTTLTTTTGTSDKICNIYDMASNALEWTTEYSNNSDRPYVVRGGYCYIPSDYTAYRGSISTSGIYDSVGFRALLYL